MIKQIVFSSSPLIYKTWSDANKWITYNNHLYTVAYDPIPKPYTETEETINVSTDN